MSLFDLDSHQMKCSKGDFTNLYSIQQINGQYIATFQNVTHPKRGSEVFIKKLPRDILLQDILEFAVQCGDVYRIRLLMDFSGYNRGYCFVTYFDPISARKAILTLNGENIKENCSVIVKISFDNNKLEMRGIPFDISRSEIFERMSDIFGGGLKSVITFRKTEDTYPQGVCVLKFETHRHALEARKKVWPRIKLWRKIIEIDWAVPHEILNAKRLYFRKAPPKITKLDLYNEVTKHIRPETMLNIFLMGGLGYILFVDGSVAFDAFLILRASKLYGDYLEFSFSKFYTRYIYWVHRFFWAVLFKVTSFILNGTHIAFYIFKTANFEKYRDLNNEGKANNLKGYLCDQSVSEYLNDQTASEYLNETRCSDFADPLWDYFNSTETEEYSSAAAQSPLSLRHRVFPSTSSLYPEENKQTRYAEVEKDLSANSSFSMKNYMKYENCWSNEVSHSDANSDNAWDIAGSSFSTECTANNSISPVYSYPLVVVPPPVLTAPGPYDEAAEIHHCVSHYFNFNHPTLRWIYASTSDALKPENHGRKMVRVLPTVNHNQYDLTLVQSPKIVERK